MNSMEPWISLASSVPISSTKQRIRIFRSEIPSIMLNSREINKGRVHPLGSTIPFASSPKTVLFGQALAQTTMVYPFLHSFGRIKKSAGTVPNKATTGDVECMEMYAGDVKHNSVDDLRTSVGNNHGNTGGKLRQIENIIREFRPAVPAQQGQPFMQTASVSQQYRPMGQTHSILSRCSRGQVSLLTRLTCRHHNSRTLLHIRSMQRHMGNQQTCLLSFMLSHRCTHLLPQVEDNLGCLLEIKGLKMLLRCHKVYNSLQLSIQQIRELLQDFYSSTPKFKPQNIIIFRDGVSESQFNQVLNIELGQIMEACKFCDESWDPKFMVIVAQMTHHTNFFQPGSDANVPPGI